MSKDIIPVQRIAQAIFVLHGQKVILSQDLAALYGVTVGVLTQAMKRNTKRELARKFSELEKRIGKHDQDITAIIEAIRQLMAPPKTPRREIGFHVRERPPRYRVRTRA